MRRRGIRPNAGFDAQEDDVKEILNVAGGEDGGGQEGVSFEDAGGEVVGRWFCSGRVVVVVVVVVGGGGEGGEGFEAAAAADGEGGGMIGSWQSFAAADLLPPSLGGFSRFW